MTQPLSKYLDTFYEYSSKASDVTRSAAFAGVALVWVFRLDTRPVAMLPRDLLPAALLFALAIGFDVLQYVAGTITWFLFHWHHEHKVGRKSDPELDHPFVLTLPMYTLFGLKVIAVGWGYGLVVRYLWSTWAPA